MEYTMPKKLLFITALCFTLTACYDKYEQELIVVNKVPKGAYAGEKMLSGELYDFGWHEIGLSRNGKEPIEYIWYAREDPHDSAIMDAEIGERGTAYIHIQARRSISRLPRPNAKKPPTIGLWGEVFWDKQE
jgi:phage terminase large subunit-like protein